MLRSIGYWTTTVLLAAAVFSGGVVELALRPETVEGMLLLGYPLYFIRIIGAWKVLGALAALAPRLTRLKEWAYAGIVFNMTGAAASHAITGAAGWHVAVTSGFALLAVVSWALRPPSRVLGAIGSPVAARA